MRAMNGGLKGLVGALALTAVAGSALADGAPGGSVKDAPKADEGRKLEWTWNIGGTTNYIFRGFSQSADKPAFQMGADLTYGIFYAGVWGSSVDFGKWADVAGNINDVGGFAEVDWYMGIKPVVGPVTFDLGVIYYSYPGAKDGNTVLTGKPYEWDYVELKAGASMSPVKNLTTGTTLFYSPEYTNKQGPTITLEGTAAYELPKMWIFTPTIGGTLGSQWADNFNLDKWNAFEPTYFAANGKDSYMYWNIGLSLAVDKLTLDFRYWDTNVQALGPVGLTPSANTPLGTNTYCKQTVFQCDEKFVFSAKMTF